MKKPRTGTSRRTLLRIGMAAGGAALAGHHVVPIERILEAYEEVVYRTT